MSDLILTDGKITNDWFKKFFENENYNRIGIQLSSGTDSALVLFFLAKFITETEDYDKIIFPWLAIETNNQLSDCATRSKQILELIKKLYPKANIQELSIDYSTRVAPYEDPKYKTLYLNPIQEKFKIDYKLDIFLSGLNHNPPESILRLYSVYKYRAVFRDKNNLDLEIRPQNMGGKLNPQRFPWMYNDKKFIAHQYKKYNLMDNLFPLTESCVIETEETLRHMGASQFPCKKCFWCVEKYWAFGMYDNCERR
jgi:hypothetical protein